MTSREELVSVIIATYNRAAYVVEAVESVLAQTYPAVEILVIDDGSTDDTETRLEPYRNQINYICQPNGGPSKARNRGIRESRGDLIALLDGDDTWLPDKLAVQVKFMCSHPDVGLVYCDHFKYREATGERIHQPNPRCYEFTGYCYPKIFFGHCVTPSASMIRRSCFDAVGLFDESIRGPSFEDQEMWLRIARKFHFGFTPEPLVVYRMHDANGSQNQLRNLEDEYKSLITALSNDPELWNLLDAQRAREKLYKLAFFAGHACMYRGDDARARWYFREALRHQALGPRSWLYWAYSFVPIATRDCLRDLRRRGRNHRPAPNNGGVRSASSTLAR
jgi:glycosyltransferase involved in cell wall biosynthesis